MAHRRCCSISIRLAIWRASCCGARSGARRSRIPLGPIRLEEDGGDAVFVETAFGEHHDRDGYAELLLRGPVVAHSDAGPLAPDRDGFVATGLRAAPGSDDHTILRIRSDAELRRHGGIALALSELDELYRGFSGFLDAACFMLPDPTMGDRVFATIMPHRGETASLEDLNCFLAERGGAPCIPRQAAGGARNPAGCEWPRAPR
jgi:mycobactin salicyl-AMP ligase